MTAKTTSRGDSVRCPRTWRLAFIAALLGVFVVPPTRPTAQAGGFSGIWTLDRDASQFPREIGFEADFGGLARGDTGATGGGRSGRGGRGSGGANSGGSGLDMPLRPRGESFDDAQRREHLTDEARMPPMAGNTPRSAFVNL